MSQPKEKPPQWSDVLSKNPEVLSKGFASKELEELFARAQEKYVYWDIFKHYPIPKEFSTSEAWAFLKIKHRLGAEQTPIKKVDSARHFSYTVNKSLLKNLTYIDTYSAGLIRTLTDKPNPAQKEQLIISGLSEEAIASSQIEGANTSRKVAKQMIYSGRKPRNTDEQMIINNYQVMQLLDDIKDLDLTEDILLDLQKRITYQTLEEESESGRFRTDADDIVVSDKLTGEIVFVPPSETEMHDELKRLIVFANTEDTQESTFVHPFIKATILHFWVAYLHPFVDGNGRTARAIFYWYLMKQGYWLFQYLSVSRVIKTSKKKYDDAFLHAEYDEEDFTYFLLYMADVTSRSISDLMKYYERKVEEAEQSKKIADAHADLNARQILLLQRIKGSPNESIDIKTYQLQHGVVYETARNDLIVLKNKGFISEVTKKKKKLYVANNAQIKKLIRN